MKATEDHHSSELSSWLVFPARNLVFQRTVNGSDSPTFFTIPAPKRTADCGTVWASPFKEFL